MANPPDLSDTLNRLCAQMEQLSQEVPMRMDQLLHTVPESRRQVIEQMMKDIIGDFRAPDVLRFGLTPLYTSFAEIERAVEIIASVMDEAAWDRPEFKVRAAVT